MALNHIRQLSISQMIQHIRSSVPRISDYCTLDQDANNYNYQQERIEHILANNQLVPRINDKQQFAIYELFKSEINFLNSINKLINLYQKPMLTNRLLTVDESNVLFANLDSLSVIHLELISSLSSIEHQGQFEYPAKVFQSFLDSLVHYEVYCLNLANSEKLLKKKLKNQQFVRFLHSEQIQKHSEKLDLGSYLDQPRRHLMQYPLILTEIFNRTKNPDDAKCMLSVIEAVQAAIRRIDQKIATEDGRRLISRFRFSGKRKLKDQVLENTILITTNDVVVDKRFKSKMKLFLLDRTLVVAKRSSVRGKYYQVRNVINTDSELYFHCGKNRTAKRFKVASLKAHWSRRLKRSARMFRGTDSKPPANILRLYSRKQPFDITVRFRSADELNSCLYKLHKSFKMIQRKDSISNSSSSSSCESENFDQPIAKRRKLNDSSILGPNSVHSVSSESLRFPTLSTISL